MFNFSEEDLQQLISSQRRWQKKDYEITWRGALPLDQIENRVREIYGTPFDVPDCVKMFPLKSAKTSWEFKTDTVVENHDHGDDENNPVYTFRPSPNSARVRKEGEEYNPWNKEGTIEAEHPFEGFKSGFEAKIRKFLTQAELGITRNEFILRIGILIPFWSQRGLVNKAWMETIPLGLGWFGDWVIISNKQLEAVRG